MRRSSAARSASAHPRTPRRPTAPPPLATLPLSLIPTGDSEQPGEYKEAADTSFSISGEGLPNASSSLSQSLLSSDDESTPSHRYDSFPLSSSSLPCASCSPKCVLVYSLWSLWFLLFVVLFVLCTLFFGLVIALQVHTMPKMTGILQLPGLQRPVTVSRDDDGLIHVQGFRRDDVFFAQGVVMAQERMWQMEMQRKVGQGRLSELVGVSEAAEEIDRLGRVLGFHKAAQSALPALSAEARTGVAAFVAGINAYLDTDPPLGVEFFVLGLGKPEPWTMEDVLVWSKVMSWTLSGNVDRELQRWDLLQKGVSKKRIEQLIPDYDLSRFPSIVPDAKGHDAHHTAAEAGTGSGEEKEEEAEEPILKWLGERPHLASALSSEASALRGLFDRYRTVFGPTHASNSWAVSGSMTQSGAPLLCNDPHLPLMAPSLWILFHLQVITDTRTETWRREDVIGASLAGIPGILIGRNNASSWALTNTGADVQDLFIMTDSADGAQYSHGEDWLNYTFVTETIRRKGASDVVFRFRQSRYGPVLSDLTEYASPFPLSLRWTSLQANDTSVNAFLELNLATNFESFRRAVRAFVAPSQNFLYADARTIGYQMSGLIPTRVDGHSGKYPVPGTGCSDWTGWVPYDDLPHVSNPKQGWLVAANNRVTPNGFKPVVSRDWDEPSDGYRALRIQTVLLNAQQRGGHLPNHSLFSMRALQADTHSLLFEDFRPLIANLKPRTDAGQQWQLRLQAFGGDMAAGSEEATVFQLFYRYLCTLPYKETNATHCNPVYLYNVFIQGDKDPNCDKPPPPLNAPQPPSSPPVGKPPASPGCLAWASDGFDDVVAGNARHAPGWGTDVKQVSFAHAVLSGSPLTCLSDRRVAHGGDEFTVNVGPWSLTADGGGFYTTASVPRSSSQRAGASYRQIIDHGKLERSLWEPSLGQSGNLISPWYDDTLDDWAEVHLLPMRTIGFTRTYVLWLTSTSAQPVDPNDHLQP